MTNASTKTILNHSLLPTGTVSEEQLIHAELIHFLFHQPLLTLMLLGHNAMVAITVFFLWGSIAPFELTIWATYMVVIVCLWAIVIIRYRHSSIAPENIKHWAWSFPAATILIGAAWGITSHWSPIMSDPVLTVFMTIEVVGITTAGIAILAPLLHVFFVFAALILIPYAIQFFVTGGKLYETLSVLFVLCLAVAMISAYNMKRAVLESIKLRIENLRLINNLTEKNIQTEQAREEAVQAGLEKSKFIAAASHDLRQPLHALGLFVAALETHVSEPKVSKIVDNVKLATGVLSNLMNAMLDISKLDAGVLAPDVSKFKIQALLERIAVEAEQNAMEKGLRFRLRNSTAVVRSDPTMLERILRNLVANAINYTEQGSILVACRMQKDQLCIEVRDSGIGIDKNKLEDIFTDFYQVDNPERDRAKGHGLGLAIVDRLAKLLGHTVQVKSAPGQGSTFSLCLPRITNLDSVVSAPSAPQTYVDDVAGAIVLVIDDEILVREGMADILTEWGCKALLADCAETAWHQLQSTDLEVDVIIADYRLRGRKTGIEAIEYLQHKTQRKISAIIVTGDTSVEHLRATRDSGYQLLHKPVSPSKLRSLLSFVLAS